MRIIYLMIAILLIVSIVGCTSPSSLPTTEELGADLNVSDSDLSVPEETISSEIDSTEEPQFGEVI